MSVPSDKQQETPAVTIDGNRSLDVDEIFVQPQTLSYARGLVWEQLFEAQQIPSILRQMLGSQSGQVGLENGPAVEGEARIAEDISTDSSEPPSEHLTTLTSSTVRIPGVHNHNHTTVSCGGNHSSTSTTCEPNNSHSALVSSASQSPQLSGSPLHSTPQNHTRPTSGLSTPIHEDREVLTVEEAPVASTTCRALFRPIMSRAPEGPQPKPKPKPKPRKRKSDIDPPNKKRQKKSDVKSTNVVGSKDGGKKTSPKAVPDLPKEIWMRIFEFAPLPFLSKARLISKAHKEVVDEFTSLFRNCRFENYGADMPPPPKGLSDRQYANLLGSKGCLEPGCKEDKTMRTHWSWAKRWCTNCWKGKIEREDKVHKTRAHSVGQTTLTKLLECIPVGMQDSFGKPHDYVADLQGRAPTAHRLYRHYLVEDLDRIFAEYHALSPQPYVADANKSAEDNAAALSTYQALMDKLEQKRTDFFAQKKKENDEHMADVVQIEKCIRERREKNKSPHDENRNGRKVFFLKRASDEIPHVDTEWIKTLCAPYKAATRIYRDPGSERGWQQLKPKILRDWDEKQVKDAAAASKAETDARAEATTDATATNTVDHTMQGTDEDGSRTNEMEQSSVGLATNPSFYAQTQTQPNGQMPRLSSFFASYNGASHSTTSSNLSLVFGSRPALGSGATGYQDNNLYMAGIQRGSGGMFLPTYTSNQLPIAYSSNSGFAGNLSTNVSTVGILPSRYGGPTSHTNLNTVNSLGHQGLTSTQKTQIPISSLLQPSNSPPNQSFNFHDFL